MTLADRIADAVEGEAPDVVPHLDDAAYVQLAIYLELLDKWNAVYNLTAVRSVETMIAVHLVDSLTALPYLRGPSWCDVGSGAGLPGIPLAIASRAAQVTLVETNGKKASFLRAAVGHLALDNVVVVEGRAEQLRDRFDTVISRAFAAPGAFVRLAGHLVASGGRMIAMMGKETSLDVPPASDFLVSQFSAASLKCLRGANRHLLVLERTVTP